MNGKFSWSQKKDKWGSEREKERKKKKKSMLTSQGHLRIVATATARRTRSIAQTNRGTCSLLLHHHFHFDQKRCTSKQYIRPNIMIKRQQYDNDNNVLKIRSFSSSSTTSSGGGNSNEENEEEIETQAESQNNKEEGEEEAGVPKEEEEEELNPETEIANLKDKLLRSLAEQENIRRIARRDVESARQFAVTSFAKSLLDTSDNLSRALESVPLDLRQQPPNQLLEEEGSPSAVLATLYEGIQMTDDGLTKAFVKNGLTKFGAVGDKFDPNLHEALFEYADETKDVGSIGQVMKVGFMLRERVLRPAEVGVIKKP